MTELSRKHRPAALLLFTLVVSLATANPHDDWRDKWMLELDEIGNSPTQEQLERLGVAVRARSTKGGQHPTENQLAVGNRAAALLKSIPGYAEHFGSIIRNKFEEEIARKESDRERMWAFETLEQLPGPETVKVLGELLNDDRNPWDPKNFHDTGPPIPNFKRASMALTRLGIKKAPVKNTNPYRSGFEDTEAHTWKLWYEQVRDGSRTFSFEGDEAVYNLSGPVSQRNLNTPNRPDRKPSSALQQNVPASRAPMVIATILLAGIAAFAVSKMRRGTGTR